MANDRMVVRPRNPNPRFYDNTTHIRKRIAKYEAILKELYEELAKREQKNKERATYEIVKTLTMWNGTQKKVIDWVYMLDLLNDGKISIIDLPRHYGIPTSQIFYYIEKGENGLWCPKTKPGVNPPKRKNKKRQRVEVVETPHNT